MHGGDGQGRGCGSDSGWGEWTLVPGFLVLDLGVSGLSV